MNYNKISQLRLSFHFPNYWNKCTILLAIVIPLVRNFIFFQNLLCYYSFWKLILSDNLNANDAMWCMVGGFCSSFSNAHFSFFLLTSAETPRERCQEWGRVVNMLFISTCTFGLFLFLFNVFPRLHCKTME